MEMQSALLLDATDTNFSVVSMTDLRSMLFLQ